MPTTRDFKSLGEFAANAIEVDSPGSRAPTDSYRNTGFTTFQQNQGKQFGVVPVSENVNQQIYNQSQFTNLVDTQGIPGWKNSVAYDVPAIVFGSDHRIYLNKRNGNINVDPAEDEYASEWWELFESDEDLSNIYSNQTPGEEGATLVGSTDKLNETISFKGPSSINGLTLQENLTGIYNKILPMQNVKILAQLNSEVLVTQFPTATLGNTFINYNVDTADIVKYSKPPPAELPVGTIGYITINFLNPIPTPYIYDLQIYGSRQFVAIFSPGKPNQYVLHNDSFSVANPTANSIDVCQFVPTNTESPNMPNWPLAWGNEDPLTRERWLISLTCFTLE